MRNGVSICLLVGAAVLAGPAHAATTFTYLFSDGHPLSVSAGGAAVAGNNVSDFGPFRWTPATGRVELGRASVPVLGRSAGTAEISQDGTRVASTIISEDSTVVTGGLWTLGQGWQQITLPPDAASVDNDLASVWGLSGDGKTVVGLYWRRGTGPAHALRWTQAAGPVDLGSTGRASRADGVNYDGSVIAGWDEHSTGFRRATAWFNGQLSILGPDQPGEARAVNAFGDIVVGYQRDPVTDIRQAAMWKRTGSTWSSTQFLGYVPGTSPSYGLNVCEGVSADGQMVVGYCTFGGDPFDTTGFVWTPTTGIQDVNQFLADHGILPDPNFTISTLSDVTPDGRRIIGSGRDLVAPYTRRTFMIELGDAVDVAATGSRGMSMRLLARPNPVQSATALEFDMPSSGHAVLSIYDGAGHLVRRLLQGGIAAGTHQVPWDGRDATGARVPAGVYFSRLEAGTFRVQGKLVVLQ